MYRFSINPTAATQAVAWRNARGAAKRVARRVRPFCSISMRRSNSRNILSDIRRIPASRDQLRAFQELREWYELEHKGKRIELRNAPSVITKCQQVSDGIVNMTDVTLRFDLQSWTTLAVAYVNSSRLEKGSWCGARSAALSDLFCNDCKKLSLGSGFTECPAGRNSHRSGWLRNGRIAVATEASGSSVNYFKDCAYAISWLPDVPSGTTCSKAVEELIDMIPSTPLATTIISRQRNHSMLWCIALLIHLENAKPSSLRRRE